MSKTLLTVADESNYTVKTNNNPAVYLLEKEYSDGEFESIMSMVSEWNVEIENRDGYDYGYGSEGEDVTYSHREIGEEAIVVEDGCFVGIAMRSSGSSFNKEYTQYNDLTVAFTKDYKDEKGVLCARSGSSFSSDDHETWNLYYYYLKKKVDNRQKA